VTSGPAHGHGVTWPEALRTWAYIGLNSFGGPAGQIAVMHRVLVDEKEWISEERFLHALNYCMLLPGPEAMQLVTYVGWLLHRTWGGLVAGLLFVAPGFLSILALSVAYTAFRDVTIVESLLFGLRAAVLAIVLEAVIRVGKRVLKNGVMYAIAAAGFVAIFFFQLPFPLLVAAAAAIGLAGGRVRPDLFVVIRPKTAAEGAPIHATDRVQSDHVRPTPWRTLGVLAVWLPLWLGPVAALGALLGRDHVFAAQAEFFSKAAVVTFGGAYAVLTYVAQEAVAVHGWVEAGEMLTGLGMAETTPGPLIQVVQFVGYMGAYRDPGGFPPLAAGIVASIIVTWVTYAPCFLWIFVGAPYVEALRGRPALSAALSAITAAVVGAILNLAVWFALHTLFAELDETTWHGMRILRPALATIDWPALAIALLAGVILLELQWGVLRTLGAAVLLSIAWRLVA
jgi:chromate transporter